MSVSRRGFLGALLALPAAAALPEIELWVPSKKIFLPPAGGWACGDISFANSDLALSIDEFSRKYISPAMKILAEQIDRDVFSNLVGSQWSADEIQRLTIRRPVRYVPRLSKS